MNFRNAQYNALGTIDCEINHPVYGWIPFTADPNDVEPTGAQVFNAAKAGAAAYVAPPVNLEAIATQARAQRNALLAATDWMALSDVTMSPEWAAYRQALRDVPDQAGFPTDINWPIAPE